MLDPRKLIMLREVASAGSIAAAARMLNYTRSAVSQQLSSLESEAGAVLLDRAGNRVTLTSAGRLLVEHTERILVELRAAEASLDRAAGRDGGLLRVGIPFREGPQMMGAALTQVRREHPRLEIRLEATTDEAGAEQVRRGQLDLVILSRYGPAAIKRQEGLREYLLGSDPLRLCVPATHALADRQSCALSELFDEGWVLSRATGLGQLVQAFCAAAGFEPVVAALVDDVRTAIGLVGLGWGITIAPELTPANPGTDIRRIPLIGIDTERHSVVIVRDGEELGPRVAPVIQAVRAISKQRYADAERARGAGRQPE